MSEPFDNWESKLDMSPEQNSHQSTEFSGLANHAESSITENDFTFPCEGSCEDDDVLTESKIKEFLEEKVLNILDRRLHMSNSLLLVVVICCSFFVAGP